MIYLLFQSGAEIGQRVGLSDKDIQKLNKMYCDADSDSVQAEENPRKKTETKKKKGKNKPFEGLGIGYHQGKAVAFKVLPAAETYKLPDVPSFHIFDYFSKEPQILSTPENAGFRIGKEIAYSYSPAGPAHHFQSIPQSQIPVELDSESEFKDHEHNEEMQGPSVAEVKQRNTQNQNHQVNPELTVDISTHDEHSSPQEAKEVDPDLIDAFDRLSKIIKMHVYPSQTPDLSAYKVNGHYSNHYDPPQIKSHGDIKFVPPVPTEANKEEDKMHSAIKFIKSMYDEKYEQQEKKNIKEKPKKTVAGSEDDTPAWYKHYEEEYASVPEYKPLEHYRAKDEYISLHSPKLHKDEKSKENQDDWFQKFSQDYPDHVYHDYTKDSLEGHEHDGHRKENIYSSSIPKRSQDYSVHRFPARLTKNMYNDESQNDR